MNSRFLFSICFLILTSGYGQYDWTIGKVVLKNNDTIKGLIQLPMISKAAIANSHKVKFKGLQGGKITRYDHTNANKYIFKDSDGDISLFEYVRTSTSKVQLFKRVYSSDKIRLYGRMVSEVMAVEGMNGYVSHIGFYPSDYNEYYVSRKYERVATPLIKVGPLTKSFRKNAMKYFADCPDLVAKLKNRVLDQNDLLKIVTKYDACK